MKKLSKSQYVEAMKLYEDGQTSLVDIGYKFGVTSSSIIQYAKRHNLYISRVNSYSINENIFDEIDSEPKAYWLGFLVADGCVCNGTISFCLSAKDCAHLKLFKNFVSSNHPINDFDNNGYKGVRFTFRNKHIATAIRNLGVPADKSHNLVDFPTIPEKLKRHFLRGVFDGDGCFNVTKIGNHKKLRMVLISTIKMSEVIQKELMEKCQLNKTKLRVPKNSPSSAYIEYKGNLQLKRIYDYFYEDATVYLERKRDIADRVLSNL